MSPPAAIEVEAVSDTSGIPVPDPLTAPIKTNDIYGRRKKGEKGQWGVAAFADSSSFRHYTYDDKPKSKRWDHYLSLEAASRKGNSLKQAAKLLGTPGLLSLGGGLPSSEYFPYDSMTLKVPSVPHFTEAETKESGVELRAGKHDLLEDKSIFDISTAFNYGQGSGAPQLLRWITEHTEMVHKPLYSDWRCTMSVGSTSALDMALRIFTRPGDFIISEEYTFATAVETAQPMGVRVAGVAMDEQGLLPSSLDQLISSWDVEARGARRPFILYTVPTGQNPTGATQGLERRKQIYAVAQKHDLYIIEDEPYYFLQMQPYTGPNAPDVPPPSSHAEFLSALIPSYLSMDTDGRVMRMDSFSKVLSPGSRCGWITASQQIVEIDRMHADVSTQGPSGISQLVLWKLLDEHWGHGGYLDWLVHIRLDYTRRRDVIVNACERFLPREVVSWRAPMAGMFHWLQIDYHKHPHYPEKSIQELEEEIFMSNIESGVLLMRGSWFYANQEEEHDTMFFRATYAAAPAEKIEEAIRRFGESLRKQFKLGDAVENGNGHVENGH